MPTRTWRPTLKACYIQASKIHAANGVHAQTYTHTHVRACTHPPGQQARWYERIPLPDTRYEYTCLDPFQFKSQSHSRVSYSPHPPPEEQRLAIVLSSPVHIDSSPSYSYTACPCSAPGGIGPVHARPLLSRRTLYAISSPPAVILLYTGNFPNHVSTFIQPTATWRLALGHYAHAQSQDRDIAASRASSTVTSNLSRCWHAASWR